MSFKKWFGNPYFEFFMTFDVQRIINDTINAKFENCESICTPFMYCYI